MTMSRKRATEASWDSDDDLLQDDFSGITAFSKTKQKVDSDEELDEEALLGSDEESGETKRQWSVNKRRASMHMDSVSLEDVLEVDIEEEEFSSQETESYVVDPISSEFSEETELEVDSEMAEYDEEEVKSMVVIDELQELHDASSNESSDSDEESGRARFKTERSQAMVIPSVTEPKSRPNIPDTLEISQEQQAAIDEFITNKESQRGGRRDRGFRGRRMHGRGVRGNMPQQRPFHPMQQQFYPHRLPFHPPPRHPGFPPPPHLRQFLPLFRHTGPPPTQQLGLHPIDFTHDVRLRQQYPPPTPMMENHAPLTTTQNQNNRNYPPTVTANYSENTGTPITRPDQPPRPGPPSRPPASEPHQPYNPLNDYIGTPSSSYDPHKVPDKSVNRGSTRTLLSLPTPDTSTTNVDVESGKNPAASTSRKILINPHFRGAAASSSRGTEPTADMYPALARSLPRSSTPGSLAETRSTYQSLVEASKPPPLMTPALRLPLHPPPALMSLNSTPAPLLPLPKANVYMTSAVHMPQSALHPYGEAAGNSRQSFGGSTPRQNVPKPLETSVPSQQRDWGANKAVGQPITTINKHPQVGVKRQPVTPGPRTMIPRGSCVDTPILTGRNKNIKLASTVPAKRLSNEAPQSIAPAKVIRMSDTSKKTPSSALKVIPTEPPEDEETRALNAKIEQQKRMREEIIRRKELRRRMQAGQRRHELMERLADQGMTLDDVTVKPEAPTTLHPTQTTVLEEQTKSPVITPQMDTTTFENPETVTQNLAARRRQQQTIAQGRDAANRARAIVSRRGRGPAATPNVPQTPPPQLLQNNPLLPDSNIVNVFEAVVRAVSTGQLQIPTMGPPVNQQGDANFMSFPPPLNRGGLNNRGWNRGNTNPRHFMPRPGGSAAQFGGPRGIPQFNQSNVEPQPLMNTNVFDTAFIQSRFNAPHMQRGQFSPTSLQQVARGRAGVSRGGLNRGAGWNLGGASNRDGVGYRGDGVNMSGDVRGVFSGGSNVTRGGVVGREAVGAGSMAASRGVSVRGKGSSNRVGNNVALVGRGGNVENRGGTATSRGGNVMSGVGNVTSRGGNVTSRGGNVTTRGGNAIRGGIVTSRGGSMTSRGGSMTSRGGSMTSRGGSMTSRGCSMTSRGGNMTSRGDNMTSRGDNMTSRGGNMTSRGGNMISRGGNMVSRGGNLTTRGGNGTSMGGNGTSMGGNASNRGNYVTVRGGNTTNRGGGIAANKIVPSPISGPAGDSEISLKKAPIQRIVFNNEEGRPLQTEKPHNAPVVTVYPATCTDMNSHSMTVCIDNISTSTNTKTLQHLSSTIGPIETINIIKEQKKAILKFSRPDVAQAFVKKYNRYMLDLSHITATLVP